jgi:threonine synthase
MHLQHRQKTHSIIFFFKVIDKIANDDRPSNISSSILDTIGKTPLVKLNKMAPEGVNVYVKCEAFNPMGSVKDRLALGCIEVR